MSARRPMLRGIRDKLLVSFSLLVTGIAVFVFAFFPARLERQAMRAMVAKAEVIRDMTAYSLSAGLYFGDSAAVGEVLAGAARGSAVEALLVRDHSGRVVAGHGRWTGVSAYVASGATPGAGFVTEDGLTYVTATEVLHGSERIGSLVVLVSLEDLRAEVATARRLGAMVGLVIFVLGFAIVYAISALVVRPLTDVSRTVKRIAAGDLRLRAVETSDEEVAQLVRAFNQMVDGLAGAQAELTAVNQQLEARVDARTAELRRAVAEQRRAQEALSESEAQARATSEMLRSLIDVAPQAIIALDMGWRVTRWNKAAEQLFGWTADEVLGTIAPIVPDELKMEALGRFEQVERTGHSPIAETVRLRKDGSRVSVLLAVGVLRDAELRPVGWIGILADLTAHKLLEEQLLQSQKMEAVGRLAGGVAHDFNNLLTVITSSAAMLADEVASEQGREDIEAISTAAMRASALTRQLLLFSRKQVVLLQPVQLRDVVREMGPMLRRLLRENIRIASHDERGTGLVTADPTQLEQVILNLAVNASDAMPDGGTLTIETRGVELDAAYAECHAGVTPGRYAMLAVSDTGVGMDAATVDKIFEPFFTTKPPGKGTGLGLATTYAVVTQLGGHIRVYSEPGQGSTFKIYLPAVVDAAEARLLATPASTGSIGEGRGATVLLVEDEGSVRRTLKRTLERLGCAVLEAEDGETGLAVAADHAGAIDIVLTDLMMPGMNGRTFADRLLAERPGLPVVFMSGYTDETVSQRGLVDATHAFLQKPFSSAVLERTLRELLHDAALAPVG